MLRNKTRYFKYVFTSPKHRGQGIIEVPGDMKDPEIEEEIRGKAWMCSGTTADEIEVSYYELLDY